MKIYLIGSLKNEKIPDIAGILREKGFEVFDEWYSPGPDADDYWKEYEKGRGWSYTQALNHSLAAKNIFDFDKKHIDSSDVGILVLPCGKSGHLELGYMIGQGKLGYILLEDDPERWDIMYKFAAGVFTSLEDLLARLQFVYGIQKAEEREYNR